MSRSFAALLDPGLDGDALGEAVSEWQAANLTPTGKARALTRSERSRATGGVMVSLPDGSTRRLSAGPSSWILKGVVEHFARSLSEPAVVLISESGEKVSVMDKALLCRLGLVVDVARLLPDCLIADLDEARDELWFIEIVATDGAVTASRQEALLAWAEQYGIAREKVRFLSAFESRTASAFKRAIPLLATGSWAWFLDEPDHILGWDELRNAGGRSMP